MSDKSEQPSARRLRQAKEKGDIPVSLALTQSGALLAGLAALPGAVAWTADETTRLLRAAIAGELIDPSLLLGPVLILAAPVLVAAAIGALATGFAQTGGAFAPAKLTLHLHNLDPVSGLQRLFKLDRLYHLIRATVAVSFVTWLCVDLMLEETRSIVHTMGRPELATTVGGSLARQVLWLGAAVSTALALVDVLVTRQLWRERNRMSKDEVKREHKESEGDAQLKHERKRAHQEMLNHANVLSVKDASVVIVNPTHLATALRYREGEHEAPFVVAQGAGQLARQIVEAARAYGISVVRDVPLARALCELGVGDEIPEALYDAIAEILRDLWEQEGGQVPQSPVT